MQHVQPEGDLPELGGQRVEVDAVHVVNGEVVLHPLSLRLVLVGRYAALQLLLLALQVGVSELVDRLVEERSRPHRRLADGQVQDLVRRDGAVCPGLSQSLLERVLSQAARQYLGRVVARRLLTISAGEAEEVGAPFVQHLAALPVPDDLVVLEAVDLALGHEVGPSLGVVHVGLRPDLDEGLLREEARVRQQPLVDGPELVDAELGVGDPAAGPPLALAGQRELLEDLLENRVPERHARQDGRALRIEQRAPQPADHERVVQRLIVGQGALPATEATIHDLEQALQAGLDEGAGLRPFGRQRDELQVAQRLEAVAEAVGVRLHRDHAELPAARLDVEEEEQAVQVGQRLGGEAPGKLVVAVELVVADLAKVPDGLVGDQLDGPTSSVLQVRGDGERVLVAVLVERVVQARPVLRRQHVTMQEAGDGLEGPALPAAEDLSEVEAQVPPLAPAVGVEEERLPACKEQHPARRRV